MCSVFPLVTRENLVAVTLAIFELCHCRKEDKNMIFDECKSDDKTSVNKNF